MSAASEAQPVDAAGDAGSVAGGPIIETLDVAKHFSAGARVPGQGRGSKPTLKAVDGVSLAIRRGETLALVGETGSVAPRQASCQLGGCSMASAISCTRASVMPVRCSTASG